MSTHTFSPVFGENITIDKHSRQATWDPKRSGGWLFSATPLEAGREITVTLNGSGHCDVGVIKTDPSKCDVMRDPRKFKKLNGIQIHKMKCCIPVCLNRDGNEVKSKYQGEVFRKSINKKTPVWISVYVKFGEVTAELIEEASGKLHLFSETHGTNIWLEAGKRKAATIQSNPAALCFVGQALGIGDTVELVCEPLKVGSKKPSRFHLKLLVCRKNPESFMKDFRSAFDTSGPAISDPPVTVLEILEKGECDGTVSITLDQSSHIRYISATNKQNNQNLNFDASNGVWVGFELYRVSISFKSIKASKLNNLGFDVPDSRIREPQNENAEDSMQPFNSFVNRLQLQHMEEEYVSEERADLMARNNNYVSEGSTDLMARNKNYVSEENACLMPRNNKTMVNNIEICRSLTRRKLHNKSSHYDTRDCSHHIYENIDHEVTKMANGYVQRQPDKVRLQNIDYLPETNHNFATAPNALSIPRPLQIPAPQKSIPSMSKTGDSPSKIIHSPYSTIPKHSNQKTLDTKVVSETVSHQHIPSTFKSLAQESMMVSYLSRIYKTVSNLAENVNGVNPNQTRTHTLDDLSHRQRSRSDDSDFDEPTSNFIKKNWVNLVENMCADKLCDHLYQACYMPDDQRQSITDLYKTNCQAANRQLLQFIKKRRISTTSLVKIFKDAEQGHLVADLKQ